MSREVHVRFWEGLAVRFRWTTQLFMTRSAVRGLQGGLHPKSPGYPPDPAFLTRIIRDILGIQDGLVYRW